MKLLLTLGLLSQLAFGAQQGVSTDFIRMKSTTAPAVCRNGDIRYVTLDLKVCASNVWTKFTQSGAIVNADINASAAIVYSKLNLATSIVNGDVAAAAAIARSKIATGSVDHVVINSSTGALSSEAQLLGTRGGTGVSNAGTLVFGSNALTLGTSGTTNLTIPSGSHTAVTLDDTQVLTNKTLTAPALNSSNYNGSTATNTSRILLPTETTANLSGLTQTAGLIAYDSTRAKAVINNGVSFTAIGAGGGTTADRELVTNGDAESDTTGWAASGSGLTWARSTSSPLTGTGSFTFAKDAANRTGTYEYITLTVGPADMGKVLQIEFDYLVVSGTFVAGTSSTDSDVIVDIRDASDIQVQPSNYKLLSNSTTITAHYSGNFQTNTTDTAYRLAIKVGTTSALAYTIKLDNISVHPSKYTYGSPITDWTSCSPTLSGSFGTTTGSTFYCRRVGKNLEGSFAWINGTVTGASASFTLPTGLSVDTAALTRANATGQVGPVVGTYYFDGGGGDARGQLVTATTTNTTTLYFSSSNTGNMALPAVANAISNTGATATLNFSVPIAGWSSSVQTSDQADTRVIAARYTLSANNAPGANTTVKYDTKDFDTHAAFSVSTGLFTVPVPGVYLVQAFCNPTTQQTCVVQKNATNYCTLADTAAQHTVGACLVNANAGDTLGITMTGAGTMTGSGTVGTSQSWVSFNRQAGPTAIAASETIAASYWVAANFAASATTPINFSSMEYDTHGAVTPSATVWKFTAPAAGLYLVTGLIGAGATSVNVQMFKNGAAYKTIGDLDPSAGVSQPFTGTIRLIAGDYIDVRPLTAQTVTGGAALATAGVTNINITRLGL